MGLGHCFKGRQFTAEVILWAVRWYLMFPVSYRDLEFMLFDRGVEVDHTTIFRWIQAYAAELEKRIRRHLRMSNGSWRVDETYVRVKGRRTHLYRAVDSRGRTIDFLLAAHGANPRTLTVDKNPPLPERSQICKATVSYRAAPVCGNANTSTPSSSKTTGGIKRLVRPGLGFGSLRMARQTLAGFETMAMIRKGQVRKIDGHDIRGRAVVIADLFDCGFQ
jgi:transposase, IS6 family